MKTKKVLALQKEVEALENKRKSFALFGTSVL